MLANIPARGQPEDMPGKRRWPEVLFEETSIVLPEARFWIVSEEPTIVYKGLANDCGPIL
jgi:hypothetical protein